VNAVAPGAVLWQDYITAQILPVDGGRQLMVAVAWPERQRRNDSGMREFTDAISRDCGREESNLHVPKDTGT